MQPGEVLGYCKTCGDVLGLLQLRRQVREGRKLLRDRERGYGPAAPGTDVFAGMKETEYEVKGGDMKIGAAFPGQYLKAADLQGRRVQVTIEKVEMEDIGGDQKPVVHFKGKDRGLVLNKTNANAIWGLTGNDDTDDWTGVAITLFPSKTDFQGKRVDCIRVDPPDAKGQPKPKPEPQPVDVDDDSIPF